MKRTKYIYKHIAAVATSLLLLLSLFPSCSEDDGGGVEVPEVEYAQLVISLGCLDNATPAYTRTIDDVTNPNEPDAEYERYIKDWWLVVLHNNKVERVLSNTKSDMATPVGDENNTHQLEVELQIDESYDFYAFANLPNANKEYLNSLQQGDEFDKTETVATIDAIPYNKGSIDKGPYFPMSSYKYTQRIEPEPVENALEIPLIRLLGKVSIEITNSTNSDKVVVNSLTLDKFRTSGSIYLLPYDEANNEGTQNLLAENMASSYMPKFPENGDKEGFTTLILIDSDGTLGEIAKGETKTFWCYANETNFMAEGTGLNNLQVTAKITNPDGTERDDSPKDTDFDFIRRNDWLRIPMQLSDVSTTISFEMQHMPIGGLPATITIPEGLTIPQATFWTQEHGGDITITYKLNSISSLTGAVIAHRSTGESYEANEEHPFTSAVLESNDEDLLINVPTDNTAAPWLDASAKAFPLPTDDEASGSFTITAQELAKSAEARIRLNMVIEGTANGTKQKVLVPYTIIIKNQKEDSWTTTDGGN